MSFLLATGSFALAVLLWRFVRKASAINPLPQWVADEMVFMLLAPLVTMSGAFGVAMLFNAMAQAGSAPSGLGALLAFSVELLVLLALFTVLWFASAPVKGSVSAQTKAQSPLVDASAALVDVASSDAGAANDPRTPPSRTPRRAA